MQNSSKLSKSIFFTVLCTLSVLIVLLGGVILVMTFVFPGKFGDFLYGMGCNGWAQSLYIREYEKSDDIKYCYKAFSLSVSLDDNEKVVSCYELMIKDDQYAELLNTSRHNAEKLNVGILEKSSMLCEEDYLVNNYVNALVDIGRVEDGWNVAIEYFESCVCSDIYDCGVYALSWFVGVKDYGDFCVDNGNGDTVVGLMQEYFDSAYAVFDENINVENNVDKAYVVVLGNRIINVGKDINKINNSLGVNSDNVASNLAIMSTINDTIKEII